MATGTNRISSTDNNHVMTIGWAAACSIHGGLGSWTVTGTKDNRVPNESGIETSAKQTATSHAATCANEF